MQARIVSSRYIAIKRYMIFNVQPLHGRNNFRSKNVLVLKVPRLSIIYSCIFLEKLFCISLFLKLTEKLQRNELIKLSVSIFVMPVRNSE